MMIEKEGKELTLIELEKITKTKWILNLRFETPKIHHDLLKKGASYHKKGELTLEQLWWGRYFQKEILSLSLPDVAIRWIGPSLGWGVFADRNFKKREFIAEYVGKVRKRKREDAKNSYCFEYVIAQGIKSSYTIDAQDEGGLARYINHSATPNLVSQLATFDGLSHVILFTKEPIAKGAQLCYDYGPDYWSKRKAPILIH